MSKKCDGSTGSGREGGMREAVEERRRRQMVLQCSRACVQPLSSMRGGGGAESRSRRAHA
eukprot:1654696-Pleurochrysis_carterae.AAC.2